MTITLLEDWQRYKAGAVLYVLKPRVEPLAPEQLRRKKCSGQVDLGRAGSMCEKELAVEGRVKIAAAGKNETKRRKRKGSDNG